MSLAATASDYQLSREGAGGNLEAFEELYVRHNRRVYLLCLRMTGNQSEAEDLTQEVFIQLFRKIDTFRGESLFTTWLHRLTVNQVLMYFRHLKVCKEELLDGQRTLEDIYPRAAGQFSNHTLDRVMLDKAIRQLPTSKRSILLLHDVEGYSHEEIAEMLGCTSGTSKSQLHKARMKLRSLLLAAD
ncbi:MAG: RNA polymerase sigma factor [Pyrinomonadaceae bacterium]|nr:RNA polymerase sigma factor [Pyrinomonadaceae bacterium]